MLRSCLECASIVNQITFIRFQRSATTLTPSKITSLLRRNEINLPRNVLPRCVESLECNQLESNNPNEDRLRVSTLHLPGSDEPTLILGVFDGHGKGTTVDLISRRLFKYIALSIHPKLDEFNISDHEHLGDVLADVHNSPPPIELPQLQAAEMKALKNFRDDLLQSPYDISANLKASFKRCDDDLSREIQDNLTNPRATQSILHYYLSAAVSGCCALVMVIHNGFGYLASTGDCRAVLGDFERLFDGRDKSSSEAFKGRNLRPYQSFNAVELNDEHNCDNIHEIRRLAASHPRSEQNTMIRNNRLLGHLMPFRAFGDFNYKWSSDIIKSCGITRAFGPGVIPSNYNSPPYLIAEPDVKAIRLSDSGERERYLVIASDGLWELFESSRDVIETVVDHSLNASEQTEEYDINRATHILRSALRSSSQQDYGMDSEELKKLYHIRLESTLTLPPAVVRNFRDDISILVLKLNTHL